MKLEELIDKLTSQLRLRGNISVTFITDDYYKDIENVVHIKPSHSMEEERIELS